MKLAVILPAYCAEAYLPECLDSVLNQTFRDFFVIAINDASTDKTGEILEAYATKDSRLQVFHLPENRGEPFACQFAMDMLKDVEVEYVARMDADDICALDRLKTDSVFRQPPRNRHCRQPSHHLFRRPNRKRTRFKRPPPARQRH